MSTFSDSVSLTLTHSVILDCLDGGIPFQARLIQAGVLNQLIISHVINLFSIYLNILSCFSDLPS